MSERTDREIELEQLSIATELLESMQEKLDRVNGTNTLLRAEVDMVRTELDRVKKKMEQLNTTACDNFTIAQEAIEERDALRKVYEDAKNLSKHIETVYPKHSPLSYLVGTVSVLNNKLSESLKAVKESK